MTNNPFGESSDNTAGRGAESNDSTSERLFSDTRENSTLGDSSRVASTFQDGSYRDSLSERVNSPEYRQELRAMSVEQLQSALKTNETAIANYRAFIAGASVKVGDASKKC